jgi:cytochrome c556
MTSARLLAVLALAAAACDHAAASAPPSPSLDPRTPVPMTARMAAHHKQEMRDHLRVVQEISAALATDDFDAIAKSAARIGWSEQQAMVCKHMGAGAPGFADVGVAFHHTADGIVAAAKRKDRAAVASALGATLAACVGCHDQYREEIVDDAAMAKLGGGDMSTCPMMGGATPPGR